MGGSKIELEPHILPRLMPDKRIYDFQIPRTTPTNSMNKLQKLEDALIKHMLAAADMVDMGDRGDRGDRGD